MDRNSVKWWGPIPAIVTPFDDRGAIDEKLLASNIDILMSKGATGIVIGGCTGEFWAMSMEERIALFKMGAKAMAGRGFVIAGSGAVRVEDAIMLTRAAHDAGCDGGAGAAALLREAQRRRDLRPLRGAVEGRRRSGDALQHPGQCRECAEPRPGAAPGRPRPHRRRQGKLGRLEQLLRHRDRRAGPPARVLRAVLGVRRAGGAGRRRRRDRLLPQHVGAGLPRPLLHRTRRQDRGGAPRCRRSACG